MTNDFYARFEEQSLWPDNHIEYMQALGLWGNFSLSDYLDMHAEDQGDEVAVQDDYRSLTWAELQSASNRVAAGLCELGLEDGDRVSVQVPNRVEWFVTRLGILRAGGVVSTMMPRFREKEMTHIVQTVKPTVYIGPADYSEYDHIKTMSRLRDEVDSLEHVVATSDGDVTVPSDVIAFEELYAPTEGFIPKNIPPGYPDRLKTSGGTTGLPKVFYWPMHTRTGVINSLVDRLGITQYDTILSMAPFPHGISTPLGCTGAFMAGATSILTDPSRDATNYWSTIRKVNPSVITAAPTQLNKMRKVADDDQNVLDTVRVLFYSGEPLAKNTAEFYENLGPRITGYYGAGVAGAPLSTCPGDAQEVRMTTVGKPIRGSRVAVVDEDGAEVDPGEVGEVIWTGVSLTPGYLNPKKNEDAFEWDERGRYWFHSEDAGTMDEHGNVAIRGRMDDMILRGGTNIFPAAIEEEILKLDPVQEAVVVGMPDPEYGQRACAFVVSSTVVTLNDITDCLDEQGLAKYKWPERVECVDELPKTAAGKIKKTTLQDRIEQDLRSEGTID